MFFYHLFFNLHVGESTLSMDGIWMLVDIIIIDPIRTNLVSQAILFHGVIVTIATQAKDGLCGDRYPMNQFLPLAIEVFG